MPKRKMPKPPNMAARSLRLFKPKSVAVKKAYSRKIKHKKGSASDEPLPFFMSARLFPPRFHLSFACCVLAD